MLVIFIVVTCVTILIQAQNEDMYHIGILNPDLIYFDDKVQRYPPLNVVPLDALNRNQNNEGYSQPNYDTLVKGQVSNAVPVNSKPINNGNSIQRPSVNLEPPHENKNIFETADRFADDEGIRPDTVGLVNSNATGVSVDNVALALSGFGINLMKSVQQETGNVVMSPYSIAILLALLQQGSMGATQQQISAALQLSPNEAAEGFKKLVGNMKMRTSQNILNSASGIFIAEGFSINPAFKRVAMNDFGSEVKPLKFSRPNVAAQKINNWVASNTNNKIDKLVTPESVGDNTQVVLVNAVYFKGVWSHRFKPEATLQKDFFLSNGGKKPANFMRMRRFFKTDYDKSINSQILILPFESEEFSLVLILPSGTTSLAAVLASLTKENLLAYQNFTPKEVGLEIPKFTVKTDTNLVSVLQKLGIINIFGPQSQLSGLGLYREFSPQVSSALHSAMLSIDEQGGTAAAATSFGVVALSYEEPSVIFHANRPFVAVLWDSKASLPMFMAKIEDPVS